jgi:exodeoxyribonuclease VII small subunit
MTKKIKTFESDMKNLEEVISQLESGDLNLSNALEAFEKGIALYKTCHDTLESADQKVKILLDDLEMGQKIIEDFEIEEE